MPSVYCILMVTKLEISLVEEYRLYGNVTDPSADLKIYKVINCFDDYTIYLPNKDDYMMIIQ